MGNTVNQELVNLNERLRRRVEELEQANRELLDLVEASELESAQERLEKIVERRATLIDLMRRVAGAANRAASVEEAVGDVVPDFCRATGAGCGVVWLADEADPGVLVQRGPAFVDTGGSQAPELIAAIPAFRETEAEPVLRAVIEAQRTVCSSELDAVLGAGYAAAARRCGLRRVTMVPIAAGDETVGCLEMLHPVEEERRAFVTEVAENVGCEIGRVAERVGLQKRLSDIGEEEQRRIGQELHDTVAQELAGIRMLAEVLRRRIEESGGDAELAGQLLHAAEQAQAHVRSLARGLVPVSIASGGLRTALEHLTERLQVQHGLSCEFRNPGGVVIDDGRLATNLYYIAQEALNNAVQHGWAEGASVELATDDESLILRITDAGQGFDPGQRGVARGSGLRIMAYRARLVGAALEVSSTPGRGTTVTCRVWKRRRGSRWHIER